MTKLALNMIVKNESNRIARCLNSVKPYVSCYVIEDTGSTDDTIEKIHLAMAGVNGFVTKEPFTDFSTARNHALTTARNSSLDFDYLLLCDADMQLIVENAGWTDNLTAPAYLLTQKSNFLSYRNVRLLHRQAPARYVGVTHEYLEVPARANLDGAYFIDHADGSNRSGKFQRDIDLLTADLQHNPTNPRSAFYLAQSYRDLGHYEAALKFYLQRATMGGWVEEVYLALVNAARMQPKLGKPFAEILATYRKAMQVLPSRMEAVHGAVKLCREAECYYDGYQLARKGVYLRQFDGLFVEDWIYRYGLLDEFSICAYWTGHYSESYFSAQQILAANSLDDATRARIAKNAEFAREKCLR